MNVDFFNDYKALMSEGNTLAKTAANPFFKSKYCPLPDVLEIVKPLAMKHNFIIIQYTMGLTLCTELRHITGEQITSTIPLPCKDHEDAQKVGGAITYMRRYSLSCIIGLGEADDDGNNASGKKDVVKANNIAPEEIMSMQPVMATKKQLDAILLASQKAMVAPAVVTEDIGIMFGKSKSSELDSNEAHELLVYYERAAENIEKAEKAKLGGF